MKNFPGSFCNPCMFKYKEKCKHLSEQSKLKKKSGTAIHSQRKPAFLGHMLRKHGLENLMVMERIDGKRTKARQRRKYLDSLGESWKDKVSPTELIRASEDRLLWQRMVANVVNDGTAT